MRVRGAFALLVTATLVAACGGDDDDGVDDSTGAGSTAPPSDTTAATTGPAEEGSEPAWFGSPPAGIHLEECLDEGAGGRIHHRDDAVVVLEPRPGAATVVADILDSELAVDVSDPNDQDPDGIQRLTLDPPPATDELLDVVHALQDAGVPVDVDYLHAVRPNYQAKPDDAPASAPKPGVDGIPSTGGEVAVFDVDVDEWTGFSLMPDQFPYEDPAQQARYVIPFNDPTLDGHGPFVADLVRRYANETTVELWPLAAAVDDPATPTGYIDGAIDEFSLLERIAEATGRSLDENQDQYEYARDPFDVINLSLGAYGCGIYPHAPLAALLAEQAAQTLFVAAAGNDGSDHQLVPAAFAAGASLADAAATRPAPDPSVVTAVDDRLAAESAAPQVADAATLIATVAPAMVSVGSATPEDELPVDRSTVKADADGDCFSNRGPWVAAWAPGAFQLGQLRPGDWYYWSGTSFAAPRFTAAVLAASGSQSPAVTPLAFWAQPSSKDFTMYEAALHPFVRFGLVPQLDYQSEGCP